MTASSSIRVKNWRKFQHYGDRRSPPWIKLYRSLLDDVEWHDLDPVAAKHLISIWIIASENNGTLPDMKQLSFRLRISKDEAISICSKLSHWLVQDASIVLAECEQVATLDKDKEKDINPPTPRKRRDESDSVEFLEFWSAYPLKEAKGAARKAFAKAITKTDPATLVSKAKEYHSERAREGMRYVKHPATWLNQECWLDEKPNDGKKPNWNNFSNFEGSHRFGGRL